MTDIQGAKGGGGQQQPATESPDSLHSVARARILDLVSEGQILGFVHGNTNPLQDIYLNETPVANADGTLNFTDVQIDSRIGSQSQTYMPGFGGVENEVAVGLELKSTVPWTQSLTDTTLSAVRIRLSVPSLQKSNTATGDITGYNIQYKIEVATDGGSFVQVITSGFTGKTTSKYERTHRINLPVATTGWVVRVTRLTANANLATVADTTTVESYTTIIDDKFRYPNSALVGIIIDAQQFSNIPTRAYDLYGRIISVPSNYDPVARTYSGAWDGSFKPAWTNNPAWVFYDLATNARYGLGQYVNAALLNKWALYQIGQYCDGLVNNGFGGMEPRFTCNLFLQTQADAYKVLQDLSSVFRGMAFWAGGAIQAVADMPSDPVYTYTQANVIGGKFTYSGSGRKTRFTTALVSWNDPNDFGRAKVEYVPDNEGIARYGIQQTSVTGFGCTSQAQAHRIGLWTLLTSRLETETVTFGVGLDGTIAAPGQIVRIADSARAGKRQGGRIHSATTTVVTVDATPTVAVGDSLTCTMPTGVTETHTVSGVSGNAITVGAPFSVAPEPESAWVVESSTLAAQTFRVISVLEDGQGPDLSFTITALAHNASKFDNIDTGAPLTIPSVTSIPPSSQPGPTTVTLSSSAVAGQVLASTLLTVQWDATPDATYYEVDWQKDNGDWLSMGRQYGLSADISHAIPGVYVARVRAVNGSGIGSVPTVSAAYTVADQTLAPGFVADLGADAAAAQATADAANAALADIASDNILSPVEKPVVIRDTNVITTEQAGIDAQATAYGITTQKTAYDTAVSALTSYLATLTTPVLWSNLTGNTTIVGATFRQKFADVYTTRQALLNAIYAAAKTKADAAQSTGNTAIANAATAQSAANAAQADATSSLATLADIASDSKLTANEKVKAKQEYLEVTGEQAGIDAQATAYAITTEKTNYDSAITTLKDYLKTTVGVLDASFNWTGITGTTAITRTTWDSNWTAVYTTRQALLNAIYAAAKAKADAAQSTASNAAGTKPVINPQFLDGLNIGWTYDNAAGFYVIANADTPDSAQPMHLARNGQPGVPTTVARNLGYLAVQVGQTVIANCCLNAISCNTGAVAQVRISWRDINHTELSVTLASVTCGPGGTYLQCVSKAMGQAPASTQFAHLELVFSNHTSGYFTATSCSVGVQPAGLGEVPDGGGRYGVHQVDGNGLAVVDFSQGAHVNKTIDYIGDGGTYSRVRKGQLNNGVLALLGTGRNPIFNGTFTANTLATAINTAVDSGFNYDGWNVTGSGTFATTIHYAGGVAARIQTGFSMPNGFASGPTIQSNNFSVVANAEFAFRTKTSAGISGTSAPAGVTFYLRVILQFLDSNGGLISNLIYDTPFTTNFAPGTTTYTGVAPAGAAQADVQLSIYTGNTDSATTLTGTNAYVEAGFWSIEYVQAAAMDTEVSDGNIYGRTSQNDLYVSGGVNRVGLRVSGSGHRLGDMRNQVMVGVGNYGAGWSGGSISYSATTTSATITAAASNLRLGSSSLSYSASSVTVSGSAGTTATYYLYYDDDGYTGGAKTLNATTSQLTTISADGRVLVGTVTVTFPTSGTGGGSGGQGCPDENAWVLRADPDGVFADTPVRAKTIRAGHYLRLTDGRAGLVTYSERKPSSRVRVTDENGESLTCSTSAPLELFGTTGECVIAPASAGRCVAARADGVAFGSLVWRVENAGDGYVQHITCQNACFWTGDDPDYLFGHHNMKPLTP